MIKHCLLIGIILVVCFTGFSAFARSDMRQDYKILEHQQQQLVDKALAEKEQAQNQARDQLLVIQNDKKALQEGIEKLKTDIKTLKTQNQKVRDHVSKLKIETEKLNQDLEKTGAMNREFEGVVRTTAKDLKALLIQSIQSGMTPDRQTFLEPVILQEKFGSMDDVKLLSDLLFEEIHASGKVNVAKGLIVDRQGREQQAKVMTLGNFTSVYMLDKEIGFLLYSDQSQRFFALSKLPSKKIRDKITDYLQGNSRDVYMDISKGGAIRQLTHELNLMEQVPKGGAIVWPILIILVLAVLILIERIIFFSTRRVNPEQLMTRLRELIIAGDWDTCRTYLESMPHKFLPKVLLTALALKDRTRPEIENALQEAILGEIPKIERFLSTLGMLAAIAPLLGLLGTVTGMINTFHVITCFGTQDPRMMSGGISEALVTTMLGLAVAIPVMLAHTLLSRRVETQISRMEEKSVAFVNMMFKTWAQRH
ncbi:MAG: MotA/TolQ/ExbB proton channel family protein [Proteobacteria bacterium]|nr:MotA/TolQ/ExbB proton channel family protein [Pseudomonadota bacterium]MBU1581136.1 MotA/TolQ/ExbB proton channel family protein [Pseudomonadota bacterium]MBU2631432.1 MotA/TolQ/ExbB proton channel family protein [Pseudomonadota bacterium]